MIALLRTQAVRATDPAADPAAAQTLENGDPFAALLAALVPGEGSKPQVADSIEPLSEEEFDPAAAPSPEAVLALVAPMPQSAPMLTQQLAPRPAEVGLNDEQPVVPAALPPLPIQIKRSGAAPGKAQSIVPQAPMPLRDRFGELAVAPEPLPAAVPMLDGAPTENMRAVPAGPVPLPKPLPVTVPLVTPEEDMAGRAVRQPMTIPANMNQSADQSVGQSAATPPALSLPQVAQTASPPPALPAGPTSTMAQQLAGQFAAALPRLRQSGGEAVLTLDPARLGRVTLSWDAGQGGASVLTIRAAEPVTAALLSRFGESITAILRADPAIAGKEASPPDLRIDIARAERAAELRPAELRPVETSNLGAARALASDTGQAREHHHAPPSRDAHAQVLGRDAVTPDDPAHEAVQRRSVTDHLARLA